MVKPLLSLIEKVLFHDLATYKKTRGSVICLGLAPVLSNLMCPNQSAFIRRRNIAENIMLAWEIIYGIKKYVIGGNIVIKLDAYDKVSCHFFP